MLEADASAFAEAIRTIDDHLRDEIQRLETSRRHIAQLTAGDSLALPPEVAAYLDRLRGIGASQRMVEAERDGWILVAARWPDRIVEWMPGKIAHLDDPQVVRLYRVLSEIFDGDEEDDPRLAEAADIMACLAEQAYAAGEDIPGAEADDDLPHDLIDALAVESDPRVRRLRELMRERGWSGWNRMERLPKPPPADRRAALPPAQPLTAPATRPETIRRCTSRKKMMTGRVNRVDAAITGPQLVSSRPKKKVIATGRV